MFNMREVTQYTLLVAILAVLIYIAVVSPGSIATTNQNKSSLSEIQDANLAVSISIRKFRLCSYSRHE